MNTPFDDDPAGMPKAEGRDPARNGRTRGGRAPSVVGMTLVAWAAAAALSSGQASAPLPGSLHVVLLQAVHAPAAPPAGLPPTVLAAMKGAIASRPFQSLQMLDQAVVRAGGSGAARLKGPGASEYVLAVSSGALEGSTGGEIGIAIHLFATKDGVLEPTAPEIIWGEFTAKPGQGAFVWPGDEKTAGSQPLVVLVTPLTREIAATFLQAPAKLASDSLAAILTGECGMVVDASWAPGAAAAPPEPVSPLDWKTASPRVEAGVLLFNRVRVTAATAGAPPAAPRAYRVALRDLIAPEFRVSFARKPQDPFVVFPFSCGAAGCVTVDGAPEAALRIRACTGTASDLLKALQMLVIQAGGGWGTP